MVTSTPKLPDGDALEHAAKLSAPVHQARGVSSAPTVMDEPASVHLGELQRLQGGAQVHIRVTRGLVEWRDRTGDGLVREVALVRQELSDLRRWRELAHYVGIGFVAASLSATLLGFGACIGVFLLWRVA
jgi:hypothetical protein